MKGSYIMKFVYVKDEKIAEQLRAQGVPFICKSGQFWVFENRKTIQLNFEHEKGSFFFSDKLTFSGVF